MPKPSKQTNKKSNNTEKKNHTTLVEMKVKLAVNGNRSFLLKSMQEHKDKKFSLEETGTP